MQRLARVAVNHKVLGSNPSMSVQIQLKLKLIFFLILTNNNFIMSKIKEKTIEETYQKLSQKEHVLKRPGMYIGSIKKVIEELWVCKEGEMKMSKSMVEYSPGFLKIVDEALTNAIDHSVRDPTVNAIKLDYDIKTGSISIWNNGKGVPIVLHKEHNVYVPELIFGQLLSGSNYNDNESRIIGGLNGLGIKLCNLFSTSFIIETVDSDTKKKFIQEYSNNMSTHSKPKITSCSTKSYTKITFIPDYKLFSMKGLEKDTIALLRKRVFDCIAVTHPGVTVYLNGEKLKGKGLLDYYKYFFDGEKVIHESHSSKDGMVWEYAIVPSPFNQFEHISFVNGIDTRNGGKHVDYIVYQITTKLAKLLESKKKLKDIKPSFIKDKLCLFLRATVVNPTFNSQTKETLTTQSKDFGCTVQVSDKFIEKIYKSSVTDDIVEFCKAKEITKLAKESDGKKTNKLYIPKLEDALWAGTSKSNECTLLLTEGDSAATFAKWGRSIVGPERYAIFPLKGKVLNVRDATIAQLMNNEEINNIKQIIGLKQNVEYTSTKELRYGRIMLCTDSDVDGGHIKSLFVNFIHTYWPSLIRLNPSFIQTLRTPIVKAIKGKKVLEFYTEQDYIKWKNEEQNAHNFQIRYFKGLGTSKKEDAQDTFRRIGELKLDYVYKSNKCDESILLAFQKDKNVKQTRSKTVVDDDMSESSENSTEQLKCTDLRKKWLSTYDKNSYIDVKQSKVSFHDLIHKELIHFSIYDNMRSIPSLCDGLKPSQRKILYYMLKKNVNKVIKVGQLSGYVSAETGYHHGEASLQGAIVNMAQDFVGTNNINILFPDGNFGSRYLGGSDAASARYIYTRLSDITTSIYDPRDSPLLTYLNDDNLPIEPEWFLPIIPMVLVNGCSGIGTGYSTSIPPYNPKDIVANILRVIDGKEPLAMKPYFKGFNGIVEQLDDTHFVTKGRWERRGNTTLMISELPVGTWVTPYKDFLESLIDNAKTKKDVKVIKKKIVLKDVLNRTKDENNEICFEIEFKTKEDLDNLIQNNLIEKEFKLTKTFSTNNMYLFSEDLILTKYTNPNDILLDFYDLRVDYYEKRREYIIKKLKRELLILEAKVRFIKEYTDDILDINKKSKDYVYSLLEKRKYPKISGNSGNSPDIDETEDTTNSIASYDYLTKMSIMSLTKERIEELSNQCERKRDELNDILSKTNKDLWKDDLRTLSQQLDN